MRDFRLFLIVLLIGLCTDLPLHAQTLYYDRPIENFTIVDKVSSIFVGAMIGAMCGGFIGALVGNLRAYGEEFVDATRGALIGASIMPFLIYEDWAKRKG